MNHEKNHQTNPMPSPTGSPGRPFGLDPLGSPAPLRPINRPPGLIALLRSPPQPQLRIWLKQGVEKSLLARILKTRPMPAYGRQSLDWIIGPGNQP